MIARRRITDTSNMSENNGFTGAPEAMHLCVDTFLIMCTAPPSENLFKCTYSFGKNVICINYE